MQFVFSSLKKMKKCFKTTQGFEDLVKCDNFRAGFGWLLAANQSEKSQILEINIKKNKTFTNTIVTSSEINLHTLISKFDKIRAPFS